MNAATNSRKSCIGSYWCYVVGESPERVAGFHSPTAERVRAYALAIHIPVIIWAISGYLIAERVFFLEQHLALTIAAICSGLIYLVERLVLSAPKSKLVNAVRILMGLVIAFLGAATVDLVVFEREIVQQLQKQALEQLIAEHDAKISAHTQLLDQKKTDWLNAQQAANCEANGTCGSKKRSLGPVYRELAKQAEFMRAEYLTAQAQGQALAQSKSQALEQMQANPPSPSQAGLLTRLQALHDYVLKNVAALVAWGLLFCLVLAFELMVVFTKLVFSAIKTADDEIDECRGIISIKRAQDYTNAVTSPVGHAQNLMTQAAL